MIDTEKCFISVLWSVNGIQSLIDVPKGMTFHADFFCQAVVPNVIADMTTHSRRKTLKNRAIHLDNARRHNSRRSQECIAASTAQRLPHLAYPPDFAPSDFLLFG
jgi:ABC-type branched-subunit amino acid transport system substrate-binding protein